MNFTFTVLLFLVVVREVTSECCKRGKCEDGTRGTPYCGVGKCNIFGCNCNGGCRQGSSSACCPPRIGRCADGTRGTPYCAYGPCNIFGCNCDGGCRKAAPCCRVPILTLVGAEIKEGTDLRCADGSKASPYCGVGKCNMIGCNCDGGCRKR